MGIAASIGRTLKQTATYWAPSSTPFNEYGDPNLATPLPIKVRWEDRAERFINMKGDEDHSRAIVWTLREVVVGSYLYLGDVTTANPETVVGADQVRRVEFTPDIKGRVFLYKLFL